MSTYAYFGMHAQALSMRTHIDCLCTQAYVCARILMPRNPNFDLIVSFALSILPNMPKF